MNGMISAGAAARNYNYTKRTAESFERIHHLKMLN